MSSLDLTCASFFAGVGGIDLGFESQGFPRSYQFPEKMANSHLYKQAGNSVAVPVVSRIADQIKLALESEIGGSHE